MRRLYAGDGIWTLQGLVEEEWSENICKDPIAFIKIRNDLFVSCSPLGTQLFGIEQEFSKCDPGNPGEYLWSYQGINEVKTIFKL